MSKILDARGLACPKPVIETRKALQTDRSLTVIVDNKAASQNVSRLATKTGCKFEIEEKDDGIYIHIECEGADSAQDSEQEIEQEEYISCEIGNNIVVVVASDTVGKGSDELGGILMRAFMHTFLEVEPLPKTMIFMNSGVKLIIKGSPVIEDLQELADRGTEILVCGTCTNYFGITDDVAVGIISNAYSIAESILQADKVVNL